MQNREIIIAFFLQKQNSLIAGLRATNNTTVPTQDAEKGKEEKGKEVSVDREEEIEIKDVEAPKYRTKKPMVLPRSDSIGSASGRKYLAPTLSDPASVRSEKDKIAASKKRNSRPPCKLK